VVQRGGESPHGIFPILLLIIQQIRMIDRKTRSDNGEPQPLNCEKPIESHPNPGPLHRQLLSPLLTFQTSMTTFSKGPLQQFIKGTSYDTHRDQLHQPQASTSSSSSSFRQQSSTTTGEDEFGSFASQPIDYTYSYQPLLDGRSYRGRDQLAEQETSRGESQDGAEINALLGGGSSLHDEVDGDWESELFATHQKNHEQDSTLPLDPLLPSQSPHDLKGKGREMHQAGDLSPTSANLLSSLSSLDLSTLAYLRNILSLPPDQAIQRYFETTESYTEDVWGVTSKIPKEVKEVFENSQGKAEEENGREKAVRRLGMLMKQLRLDDTVASSLAIPTSIGAVNVGERMRERGLEGERIESKSQAELDREEWAREWAEYPIAAAHVRSPPKEHFKVSRY